MDTLNRVRKVFIGSVSTCTEEKLRMTSALTCLSETVFPRLGLNSTNPFFFFSGLLPWRVSPL